MAGLAPHANADVQIPMVNQPYPTTSAPPSGLLAAMVPSSATTAASVSHSLSLPRPYNASPSVIKQSPQDLLLSDPSQTYPALGRNYPTRHHPMAIRRKCSVGLFSTLLGYLTLSTINRHANRGEFHAEEESRWINSSHSWLDRQACRWIGVCGAAHIRQVGWVREGHRGEDVQEQAQVAAGTPSYWTSGEEDPDKWSEEQRIQRRIPSYVFDYVPYVHLFSGEEFWPCDIADHLVHTSPYLNYTPIEDMETDRTLDNLDEINRYGRFTYLQSDDNVEERPKWLGGSKNIPTNPGEADPGRSEKEERAWHTSHPHSDRNSAKPGAVKEKRTAPQAGGHSSAPAVLVVVPKGDGVVDAFWFYFYSYNLGNQVLNVRFGNHVGDWEHSVVRFRNGTPDTIFISEHSFGEAYAYSAVEKIGKRPVIYSATGTHAMYATPGLHPYVLPLGLLHDQTDKGPLWDPLLNHHAYVYDHKTRELRSSTQTPKAPTSWFNYAGRWGDKIYPLSDPRQYRFAGQYHYVSGPLGPRFKNLGRHNVCQGNGKCVIKHWLGGSRIKRWVGWGSQEELEPADVSDIEEVVGRAAPRDAL
ncbi:hypothetical protein MBLNU459_g7923t1 [Dothideomycetes sp. NU459]